MRYALTLLALLALAGCSTQGRPTGTLVVAVAGLPDDAPTPEIQLEGPIAKTIKGGEVVRLPEGTYIMHLRTVHTGRTVYRPKQATVTVELERNKTTTVQVEYALDVGSLPAYLVVAIGGLPENVEAKVVVKGEGYETTLTSSQILRLQPGPYVITAYPVMASATYTPTPEVGTVVLEPGSTKEFTITYAATQE